MEKKVYFESLDAVKGLAIFLVVLGHSVQCGSGSAYYQDQSFFDNVLFMFIYSFHMPLFMIVSGFLHGMASQGRSLIETFKSRTIRLLLPICVWESMIMLLSLMRGRDFDIAGYLYSIIAGFWFLWSVWWANILCSLIEALGTTNKRRIIFHLLIIFLGFFTPDELNFSLHKFMYIIFLVGYIAAKGKWESWFNYLKRYKIVCFFIMAGVYMMLFLFFQRDSYIYLSGWTLIGRSDWGPILGWDIYRIVIGVIGSSCCILLVNLIVPKGKWKLLGDIGKNSNGIYILQTYAVVMLMKISAGVKPQVWLNVVETLLICAGCYFGVKVLSRFPNAAFMLFGQQSKEGK